ncbi:hypothetical protein GGTG_04552 [Gaeumannomyces tritici R3-111a-1]|uniref:F-box domain-containing protein n=1 Tax=Gaeumannomyces tritici (strain R3-111a-1) TaxID=644352 RepID=J3NTF3_GAET3|nr:hypothetical protein GGTG_04552 [Gaeumannomyces tritici R3-111a-1]EJT79468.1 hypothetical protein GGTG_04552 [Gaeumannomyces tritici R3-111a-1]
MSHEAASPPFRLLSLAPELQLHILSWLEYDAPSILSVRLVNRQISTISEGFFAKTFLWSLTVNPFTDDLYRLHRVADHEHFRHHVGALEIQPFRHPDDPLPKRLRKKVIPGWAKVANGFEVDHTSPTAQDFLHCLSRLPNCVSFSIRDIDEWGRVVEDDEIPRLAPPTDCLALLIRAAAAPAQPVRIRSLRVIMSGIPEDGCVRPQHLPIELVRSGAFRQNLATNLRTLHLSPFFRHPLSSWEDGSHSEDSYFKAFMLIVSAAENLESLVLGGFHERTGRLVRELANMSTFPSRLRHFVLTGGVYHDPEDKRVSTSDLIKVLKRAGAGGVYATARWPDTRLCNPLRQKGARCPPTG